MSYFIRNRIANLCHVFESQKDKDSSSDLNGAKISTFLKNACILMTSKNKKVTIGLHALEITGNTPIKIMMVIKAFKQILITQFSKFVRHSYCPRFFA